MKVVANAGGVNPIACAREVRSLAPHLKVAVVLGDDLFHSLDSLLGKGHSLSNMETGQPLAAIRDRILSANAYIGAFPSPKPSRGEPTSSSRAAAPTPLSPSPP